MSQAELLRALPKLAQFYAAFPRDRCVRSGAGVPMLVKRMGLRIPRAFEAQVACL